MKDNKEISFAKGYEWADHFLSRIHQEELDKWRCKECDGIFYAPIDKRDDTDFCPYCDHACLERQ